MREEANGRGAARLNWARAGYGWTKGDIGGGLRRPEQALRGHTMEAGERSSESYNKDRKRGALLGGRRCEGSKSDERRGA